MMRRLLPFCRERKGTALIEFAFVVPILLTLFMGSFELTRVILASMKVSAAAQTLADLIAAQSAITTTSLNDFYKGTQLVMTPFSGTPLKAAMTSVTFSKTSGAASVAWQNTRGGASNISGATSLASGMGNKGDSIILVQTTYAYTSPISYVLPVTFSLTQTAYARPRNVSSVTGSSGM